MSTIVTNPVKQTKVIMLSGRYFSRFGKKGQVQTAWSLAGAKTFNESCDLNPVLKKLDEKSKKYTVEQIELFERVDCYPPRELFKLRHRLERMMTNSCTYHSFEAYKNFNHEAKHNLVEKVMLTTLQWHTAERNNSHLTVAKVNFFFQFIGTERGEAETLAERLETFKEKKANPEVFNEFMDDCPF